MTSVGGGTILGAWWAGGTKGGGAMSERATRWPDVLFETPYTWGDTKFLEEEALYEAIRFLSKELGWEVDASECRQWVHRGNGEYRPVLSYGKEFTFPQVPSVMRFRPGEIKGEWEP